jgi:hypothetical protein
MHLRIYMHPSRLPCDYYVLQMWFSPFHELTVREVEYLVRGIAEVYGEDVDEELLQEQQALQGNTGVLVMQVGLLPAVALLGSTESGKFTATQCGSSRAAQVAIHSLVRRNYQGSKHSE